MTEVDIVLKHIHRPSAAEEILAAARCAQGVPVQFIVHEIDMRREEELRMGEFFAAARGLLARLSIDQYYAAIRRVEAGEAGLSVANEIAARVQNQADEAEAKRPTGSTKFKK